MVHNLSVLIRPNLPFSWEEHIFIGMPGAILQ